MGDNVQNCPYVLGHLFNNNLIQNSTDSEPSMNEIHGVDEKYVFDDAVFRSSSRVLELPSNNTVDETHSSSDAELSDTESAHQAMSLSSPEDGPHPEVDGENDAGLKCNEDKDEWESHSGDKSVQHSSSTPESDDDDDDNVGNDCGDEKRIHSGEKASSSSEGSDGSDYVTSCSLIGPVRHDVRKAERLILGLMSNAKPSRTPEESDEQYARRVRKHNYLSMAQEFAARNRMPSGRVDKPSAVLECEPSSTRQVPLHSEEDQRYATTVSAGESRELAKNLKNSAKCNPSEIRQYSSGVAHCRPSTFETLSLKDSSGLLLPVNSLIGPPSLNQNAIHRHHQRSLAEYDACLSRERGRPLELPVASPRQGCQFPHPKTPSRSSFGNGPEPANQVRNRYSDLPANVAKMARCVPVGSAVRQEGKPLGHMKGTRKSGCPVGRTDEPPANLGKRCHIRDGRLLLHEKQGCYRNAAAPSPPHEILGGFDVYNIETTMPTIDWIAMEEHLTKAAKEEMIFRKEDFECVNEILDERDGFPECITNFYQLYYDTDADVPTDSADLLMNAVRNRTVSFLLRPKLSSSDEPKDYDDSQTTGLLTLHRYNLKLERTSDGLIRIILPEEEDGDLDEQHRNNREEIRRKLAMGSDADDYYDGERTGRKPSLQSRLQSGMNLQICFMNETVNDHETVYNDPDTQATVNGVESLTTTTTIERNAESVSVPDPELPLATIETVSKVPVDEATDIISKQAKLQAEARLALAQAKQMAHMQMEVEKQRKKKSPIAEMVGIQFPDGRHKVSRHALSEMNVAQLQVIVNDLHTQIENLNEELVRLLLERDDLHMEQDSMLVDIEDLTRYL